MQAVSEFLKSYFDSHKDQLNKSYPGIKYHRFQDEFLQFNKLEASDIYTGQGANFFAQTVQAIPLEYIQKQAHFYRSTFYVDARVLIPRSETEILVEDSLSFIHSHYHENFSMAEIGTGSFALGLSILIDCEKPLYFWGGDISKDALEVSKINLFRHHNQVHPDTKIDLYECDRLLGVDQKFDLIVSNPPYIKEKHDREGVHFQADRYEPHEALYLPDGSYDTWFETLFEQVSNNLASGGLFIMEGHEDNLLHLEKNAMKYFSRTWIKKDYTNRNRFLHAVKE